MFFQQWEISISLILTQPTNNNNNNNNNNVDFIFTIFFKKAFVARR